MENKRDYEKMYSILMNYENELHKKNQHRIKVGLRCLWTIPLVFLFLLFLTNSSKEIFLILWIVSLFGIGIYLILVEYADYKIQEKLGEISGKEETQIKALISDELKLRKGRE